MHLKSFCFYDEILTLFPCSPHCSDPGRCSWMWKWVVRKALGFSIFTFNWWIHETTQPSPWSQSFPTRMVTIGFDILGLSDMKVCFVTCKNHKHKSPRPLCSLRAVWLLAMGRLNRGGSVFLECLGICCNGVMNHYTHRQWHTAQNTSLENDRIV